MLRFFSNIAGLIPAGFILVFGTVLIGKHQDLVFASAWTLVLSISIVSIGSYFAFSLIRFLCLAAALRLMRGSKAVNFASPGECRSFSGWLAYEWRYFGNGGLQHGERMLGLEVAYTGSVR